MASNLMHSSLPMHLSPRCTATSKRSGKPCQAPAVCGWKVCRMHGARGGAPKGKDNGAYRHGQCTNEAKQERQLVSEMTMCAKDLASSI